VLGVRGMLSPQTDDTTWVAVEGLSPNTQVLVGQLGSLREGLQVSFAAGTKAP